MPISNAAETIWIKYNGEDYDAHELQDELGTSGYVFRSQSDTKVILHGYACV